MTSLQEFLANLAATPRKHLEDDDDSLKDGNDSVGIAGWLLLAWFSFVFLYIIWQSYHVRRNSNNNDNDSNSSDTEAQQPDFAQALRDTTLKVQRRDIVLPGQALDDNNNEPIRRSLSSGSLFGHERRSSASYLAVDQADRGRDSLDALERADSFSFDDEDNSSSSFLDEESESSELGFVAPTHSEDQNDNNGDNDDEVNTKRLRIPLSGTTTVRTVPCLCAICLSSFKPRQLVSWASTIVEGGEPSEEDPTPSSQTTGCVHVFHTSCMVHYCQVAWKNHDKVRESRQVACPLCREAFVSLPPASTAEAGNSNRSTHNSHPEEERAEQRHNADLNESPPAPAEGEDSC